jgi:predicted peptidase
MRIPTCFLIAMTLVAGSALAQQEPPPQAPTKPGDYKFIYKARIDGKPVQMTYVLILPKGYDTNPNQKWPMVVFTHGAGECGTDGEALYSNGPAMEVRRGNPFKETFPFIVLCPQCPPRGERWDQPQMYKAVSQIVDAAIKSVHVDVDRVYLTGLSMGGKGCWLAALEGADRFAAIAPICAGTTHPDAAGKLRYVAVWMISGTLDGDAVNHNNEMAGILKNNLAEVRNTIVPGADHGVWPPFYASAQFYEWLLSHKRPNPAERREMEAAGPYFKHVQAPPRMVGHHRLEM